MVCGSFSGDDFDLLYRRNENCQMEKRKATDDFKVTDEMREWIEIEKQKGNVASEIDISHATQKFIVHNEGKKHKFWIQQWKLWMMNERPKQAVVVPLTASQKQVQLFRELDEEGAAAYAYLDE